ncbi:hypothetical protein BJX64DRAFT_205813 [Aspergillus heterothallicus]
MDQPRSFSGPELSSRQVSPVVQIPHRPYSCFDSEPLSATQMMANSESEISDERHNPRGAVTNPVSNPNTHSTSNQTRPAHPRHLPSLQVWQIPNDTIRAPTLAAKSLDLQTREMFNTSLCTVLIPATFAAFSKRVDQHIIDFIRDDQRAQCPPIEWTVRCYATWHLATLHSDADLLAQSRYMYGVLMRYVQSALDDPRKRSSEITLIVAFLLGIYEVVDGTSPGAWLVHIRGAKEILRRRGAAAHLDGFSRTIVLSCRAFLIAEAFAGCRECLLAEGEWVDVNARAFEREDRRGRGCRLVSLIDRVYREIVQVPGLVARTRRVLEERVFSSSSGGSDGSGYGDTGVRDKLRAQIRRSQGVLKKLRRRLTCISEAEDASAPTVDDDSASPASLVDPKFVETITRHNIYAVCAIEELLGRLLIMLDDAKEPESSCAELKLIASMVAHMSPTICISTPTPALAPVHGSTALDFLFLSLGVMAL